MFKMKNGCRKSGSKCQKKIGKDLKKGWKV